LSKIDPSIIFQPTVDLTTSIYQPGHT